MIGYDAPIRQRFEQACIREDSFAQIREADDNRVCRDFFLWIPVFLEERIKRRESMRFEINMTP